MAKISIQYLGIGPLKYKRLKKWIYLGTNSRNLRRLEHELGAIKRFSLNDRLKLVSLDLRQDFLDLVTSLESNQTDKIGFWKTRLSWKPVVSELFLGICYQHMVRNLKAEAEAEAKFKDLCVFVDDPWLFAQLKANLNLDEVSFTGS